MLHQPASSSPEEDYAGKLKSRLGLKLFFFYAVVYSGFVFIGISQPSLMGKKILMGLNLAIIYGFGLILLAIIMGFLYHLAANRLENKMNQKKENL
jgi:uncharacterized membrane protein (DUF485 family)